MTCAFLHVLFKGSLFDKLTALSKIKGPFEKLTALSKVEGPTDPCHSHVKLQVGESFLVVS
jgi:hypothetical protein